MRVRVFEESSYTHYGRRSADWQARCDCGEALHAGDWEACMTWACGHLGFSHSSAPDSIAESLFEHIYSGCADEWCMFPAADDDRRVAIEICKHLADVARSAA